MLILFLPDLLTIISFPSLDVAKFRILKYSPSTTSISPFLGSILKSIDLNILKSLLEISSSLINIKYFITFFPKDNNLYFLGSKNKSLLFITKKYIPEVIKNHKRYGSNSELCRINISRYNQYQA